MTELQKEGMISSATNRESTADRLNLLFREKFGVAAGIFCAPGRLNLIGEHTDYNDGFVMPSAIGFYTWVAIGMRRDRHLQAYSDLYDETVDLPLDDLFGPPRRHWSDFVRGVAATLQEAGHELSGASLFIHGEVPLGAGLSSSASLEVALALALTELSGVRLSRLELAKVCQRAEHEFVGTRCGIMDQFIAGFGMAGHALMLDCRSLEYQMLPVPGNLRLVVCNSMVRHDLASGEYNMRRSDCETAVKLLQPHLPGISALRDVEITDLERFEHVLPVQIFRRCRHVVTENQRVLEAARALEAKDPALLGQLMYRSHTSLRDDYEVSCKELDLLVDLASHSEGVYGARMTGGGFGGCTINLVRADCAESFQKQIAHAYRRETGLAPAVYVCEPAQGAGAWSKELRLSGNGVTRKER
jgi:galactokinase